MDGDGEKVLIFWVLGSILALQASLEGSSWKEVLTRRPSQFSEVNEFSG